jgi:cytochrome c-type biogenesis protein CcmH/NrfF
MLNFRRETVTRMALSAIEQLALWGPPVLMLLITIGYYISWGKEADERTDQPNHASGGDR